MREKPLPFREKFLLVKANPTKLPGKFLLLKEKPLSVSEYSLIMRGTFP